MKEEGLLFWLANSMCWNQQVGFDINFFQLFSRIEVVKQYKFILILSIVFYSNCEKKLLNLLKKISFGVSNQFN